MARSSRSQATWSTDHLQLGVVFALCVLLIGGGWFVAAPESANAPLRATSTLSHQTPATSSEPLPTRLRIPSLSLSAPFGEPLGILENGEVQVPDAFDEVGYYRYGPRPGALGPAVVLGHVDSYQGPAIFFSLGELVPGDEVLIDRADGTVARFVVTHLERYDQRGFPTEKVYSDLDHAGLRLITCSGTYDRGTQRYTHNLIVFARAVQS